MSRQQTPEQMVQKHAQQIRVEIAHWLNLRDYGCSDPACSECGADMREEQQE